jgi:hypothetical protein
LLGLLVLVGVVVLVGLVRWSLLPVLLVVLLVLLVLGADDGLACQLCGEWQEVGCTRTPGRVQAPGGTQVVMVMSRRSREAFALAKALWTYWDLGPGTVEVRWTDGWFPGGFRQGWEIAWDDGPTVARMRQAAHQVPSGPAIGELVREDLVRYERSLTLVAWAASLVRYVRDGGQVPHLVDLRVEEAWRAELECTDFPERARTPTERALAEVLVRRALRDYRQGVAAVERAWQQDRRTRPGPPLPEVLVGRALATFSQELAALERAGNVIELPHHGLDRDDGLGLP